MGRVMDRPRLRENAVLRRTRLAGARADKLYFAQVREDPLLEIEALRPRANESLVVVSSGGCTALSLIARGAGRVVAVDLNSTQNHLVELKAAAMRSIDNDELVPFLGAGPMSGEARIGAYHSLRWMLSGAATGYWDHNQEMIARGVLNSGVSERFIRLVAGLVKTLVHPQSRIDRLLACRTLDEQQELYNREWNNRRWRALFNVLLSRRAFNRAYDSRFFENVANPSFAAHFRKLFEHALCEIPVATNYFLHHMLHGEYPTSAIPPYLEEGAAIPDDNLELINGGFAEYLATVDDDSIDGLALSNICEWLNERQIFELVAQVARVAKPRARVCFRNFVGYTEIPTAFRSVIKENPDVGREAIRRDRSCLQSRIVICEVEK
jgi:S-adenosylmethionine-diacylglycerol 3-amino-3-carboxypropyl transferase